MLDLKRDEYLDGLMGRRARCPQPRRIGRRTLPAASVLAVAVSLWPGTSARGATEPSNVQGTTSMTWPSTADTEPVESLARTLVNAFVTADTPETRYAAAQDMVQALNVGVYSASGAQLVAGAERSADAIATAPPPADLTTRRRSRPSWAPRACSSSRAWISPPEGRCHRRHEGHHETRLGCQAIALRHGEAATRVAPRCALPDFARPRAELGNALHAGLSTVVAMKRHGPGLRRDR